MYRSKLCFAFSSCYVIISSRYVILSKVFFDIAFSPYVFYAIFFLLFVLFLSFKPSCCYIKHVSVKSSSPYCIHWLCQSATSLKVARTVECFVSLCSFGCFVWSCWHSHRRIFLR